ncbi:MAG: hypothetical protein J6U56_04070 [Spirochaetia bacterium]|nr:hypothetical protein [Spirochaetia bacterium]
MATEYPLNLGTMTEKEFNSEMEKSYKSMKAGKGVSAKKAFAKVKRSMEIKNRPLTATG